MPFVFEGYSWADDPEWGHSTTSRFDDRAERFIAVTHILPGLLAFQFPRDPPNSPGPGEAVAA